MAFDMFEYILVLQLQFTISQTDLFLVNLSSKTYVFEDKMAKY